MLIALDANIDILTHFIVITAMTLFSNILGMSFS